MKTIKTVYVMAMMVLFLFSPFAFGTYLYIAEWGTYGSGNGYFRSPRDIAIDSSGKIYVSDNDNNRIQKFNSSGQFITKWPCPDPMGLAVDQSGNVYVADAGGNRIHKFGSNDGLIYTETNHWFANHPIGLTLSPSGKIFVAEVGTDTIKRFTVEGVLEASWGGPGSGDGQFNIPTFIAADSLNFIYVADYANNRIQKFDENGFFIKSWNACLNPQGVAVDSSNKVYVAAYNDNLIKKFTSNGDYIEQWGSDGSGPGEFTNPIGIEIGSSGYVYVADHGNHRIQVFAPEPPIEATVDIDPDTLNLQSNGKWITCYITLPAEVNVTDVNADTVLLNGTIKAEWTWVEEEEQMMMAKFSRSAVPAILQPGPAELTVSGQLNNGTLFEGKDTITVINEGKP